MTKRRPPTPAEIEAADNAAYEHRSFLTQECSRCGHARELHTEVAINTPTYTENSVWICPTAIFTEA
jgi:hypothetical protein